MSQLTSRVLASAATGVAAAGATRLAYLALTRFPPGGEKAWARVNHRGEPVTLLEGPAAAAGAALVAATLAALSRSSLHPSMQRDRASRSLIALAAAGGGAMAFGALDDLKGSSKRRGLRGHLGALAHGEVTTGAVKLAGIGAAGAAGALLLRSRGGSPLDCAVNAGLIAGAANLLNLFDLRPGRAIKVGVLSAGLIGTASACSGGGTRGIAAVAAPAGAALAVLPEDLGERAMLGDTGANALGAMLGVAAAASLRRPARIGTLAGIVALTAASERVSFTKVIARTPALNWLDMLGRRPYSPGGATPLSTPRQRGGDPPFTPLPRGTGTNRPPLGLPPTGLGTTLLSPPSLGDWPRPWASRRIIQARLSARSFARWRSLRRGGHPPYFSGGMHQPPGPPLPE